MSMIKDIKTYLQDNGIDETMYLGNMPNSPDKAIALFEMERQSNVEYTDLKRIGMQVVVRGEAGDYESIYALMESIHEILNAVGNEMQDSGEAVVINESRYFRILQTAGGVSHMKDESGRLVFKRDYTVIKS